MNTAGPSRATRSTLSAPSALKTALALHQAISRKADPAWHVCGIPAVLYSDHGRDFTSHHMDQAFVSTGEYRRFTEFADAVRQNRYIGLCYGAPGVGKTLSARQYANWDGIEPYLRHRMDSRRHIWPGTPPLTLRCTRTVMWTAPVAVTPRQIEAGCSCGATPCPPPSAKPGGRGVPTASIRILGSSSSWSTRLTA